jgi:hypothetical protein
MNLNEYIRRCVERRTLPPVIPEVNRQTATAFLSNWCKPQPTNSSDEYSPCFWSAYLQCG